MNNDLISREDLKRKLQYVYSCDYIASMSKEGIVSDIIDNIDNAPTVEDRPKGKWIAVDLTFGRSFYSCTICDKTENVPTCMNKPKFKFCPNCGAEMRGGQDDDTN